MAARELFSRSKSRPGRRLNKPIPVPSPLRPRQHACTDPRAPGGQRMKPYDPEAYWSRVGSEIKKRGENSLAGDDNHRVRYKRQKFLGEFLDSLDFRDRTVLELGCGPGGNLRHLADHHEVKRLVGVDIADAMRELAARNLRHRQDIVDIHKTDSRTLPLGDQSVDS